MPALPEGWHWRISLLSDLSKKIKMMTFKEVKGNLKPFSQKTNGSMHSCKTRCCARKFKALFHQRREAKVQPWSGFALKAAFPINPVLSSSLLTQTKHWKATGCTISHFITLCSKEYRHCHALTSFIQRVIKFKQTVTMAKIPKLVQEGSSNFLLCLSHKSMPGKCKFKFMGWLPCLIHSPHITFHFPCFLHCYALMEQT